jgi:hypothetical protein
VHLPNNKEKHEEKERKTNGVPHRRSQYCGCTDEQYYITYCSYVERPGQQPDNVTRDGIVKASIIIFYFIL